MLKLKFTPAVILAFATLVIALDQHPIGAVCLIAVLIAGGIACALTKGATNEEDSPTPMGEPSGKSEQNPDLESD